MQNRMYPLLLSPGVGDSQGVLKSLCKPREPIPFSQLQSPQSKDPGQEEPLTLAPPTQACWLRPLTKVGVPFTGCAQSTPAPVNGRGVGSLGHHP